MCPRVKSFGFHGQTHQRPLVTFWVPKHRQDFPHLSTKSCQSQQKNIFFLHIPKQSLFEQIVIDRGRFTTYRPGVSLMPYWIKPDLRRWDGCCRPWMKFLLSDCLNHYNVVKLSSNELGKHNSSLMCSAYFNSEWICLHSTRVSQKSLWVHFTGSEMLGQNWCRQWIHALCAMLYALIKKCANKLCIRTKCGGHFRRRIFGRIKLSLLPINVPALAFASFCGACFLGRVRFSTVALRHPVRTWHFAFSAAGKWRKNVSSDHVSEPELFRPPPARSATLRGGE